MTGADVMDIVTRLEGAGIRLWLDGGWGVDALIGDQTRPHSDLDAVVELDHTDDIVGLLGPLGYRVDLDDRPTRIVLAGNGGRRIDLHPIVIGEDGSGRQIGAGPNAGDAIYPAEGLRGVGRVAGCAVACLTPDLLLRHHTGYETQAKDWHNVRLLCERFHLPVPKSYARWLTAPQPTSDRLD